MNKGNFRSASLIILSLIVFGFSDYAPEISAQRQTSGLAEGTMLSGRKAIEHLKQTGEYESFARAVETASIPSADATIQQRKLTASDGAGDDRFGNSVAMVGNKIIIGAYTDDIDGKVDQGSAYVFVRNGTVWTQEAKLIAPDGAAQDLFGFAVAFDGVNAVITSYRDDVGANIDQGSAYVFENSGNQWTYRVKLTASDGTADDLFGASVAMVFPNYIYIGAVNAPGTFSANQGAVYMYGNFSGTFPYLGKLLSGDPAGGDAFGRSLAIDNGTMAVGANGDDGPNGVPINQGAVHVYTGAGGNWNFQARLTHSDPAAEDRLGTSVAISGNRIIAGAPDKNNLQGAAYIFQRSGTTWAQQTKLLPADTIVGDAFGISLAITENAAFVGAMADDGPTGADGSVYTFGFNTGLWVQRDKLTASDGGNSDFFGASLALWRNTLVIGTPDDTIGANVRQGSVYIYPARPARFDFEGDGRAEIGVFRPANGVWHLSQSSTGNYTPASFGASGDKIAPADYDGDGRTDIGVFRPSNGTWYWINSSNNTLSALGWGQSGDIPMPSLFRDGDFRADPTVFRPSNGTWYIFRSNGSGYTIVPWGQQGDIPFTADFFGEGLDNIGVFRPSNGAWYLRRSNNTLETIQWGANGDVPVPADYDGDGTTDVAVYRRQNGAWYIRQPDGSLRAVAWGTGGDRPVAADYDGDGIDNIGVFRPSNGTWYVLNANGGYSALVFGVSADQPIPAAYVSDYPIPPPPIAE